MSRRANWRQADVERIIRAAKRQGAARVTVKVGEAEVAVDLGRATDLQPLSTVPPVAKRRLIVT